jgi:gliding motility-associated-like protein
MSENGSFSIEDAPVIVEGIPFAADLNTDGAVDVNLFGKNLSGDVHNRIDYAGNTTETLPHQNVLLQRFGDYDGNGTLDLASIVSAPAGSVIRLFRNAGRANGAPGKPQNAVAIPVYNRVFLYWDRPGDDHTPELSISYDVYLESHSPLQTAAFDLINEKRLRVTHGNNGLQNFMLVKDVAMPVHFTVQAVDNAHHAGGLCIGGGSSCAIAEAEQLHVCNRESVTLTAPDDVLWFSFAAGFIGNGKTHAYAVEKSDTVFYYNPKQSGCSGLKVFVIRFSEKTIRTEESVRYACADSTIQFQVENGWDKISWRSVLKGNLGNTTSLHYKVTQPDSVVVTLSNSFGCTMVRKTAVKISKPELLVNGTDFKIVKGASVQLVASGATRYTWSPSEGLNQTTIANPVATPLTSIEYVVRGYDSLGCAAEQSIRVLVESSGFIPTLFTPNDDGKNDRLKIYGITSASNFSFSIFNREGAEVYRTTNITEVTQQGWDGRVNGVLQPSGVYFWKVQGAIANGKLLLNGKHTGSFVLVR